MRRICFAMVLCGFGASRGMAVTFYDCTNPNPPVAFANLDQNVLMMDDVLIPTSRLNGATTVSITSIQSLVYASSNGTYTVSAWIGQATIAGGVLQPVFPVNRLDSQTAFYGGGSIRTFTVGDGVNRLTSIPVLPITYQGNSYGVFFYGLMFSAPLQNIGWCLADGPDANIDAFYGYYGIGDSRNGVKNVAGYRSSFNILINGTAVPEPGSWVMVGVGLGLVAARRRRGCAAESGSGAPPR